jgi:hypothetical protein
MEKYFPIKTDTACQLKWNWSTIFLYNGITASCHRTSHSQLTIDTFDNFHNTEKKKYDRQLMLQGTWPTNSCNYCQDIEKSGGTSDRIRHLAIPNQSPVELEHNASAIEVFPTILEIYFNNQCNLSCLYCTPWLSSTINQENKKHGRFEQNGVILESVQLDNNHSIMLEKFWEWMNNHSHRLVRFNAAGGEPFYQPEFDNLLEYFEQTAHPNLELAIITNLMVSSDRLDRYIKRFKKLVDTARVKRVDITCSLDCLGDEQEYTRYGLDINTWLSNFQRLLQESWLTLNINQTISVLTIKTMPALIEQIKTWRQQHTVGHFFSVVSPGPSYLDPKILGPQVFKNDFALIIATMPDNTNEDRDAKAYMSGIANQYLQSSSSTSEILKLKTFLDEKDRRRGTNWKITFPWLVKELEHVVQ